MELSNFGKTVRKIRIDKNIMQKDMAYEMDYTPAYLSAIESGKRILPDGFLNKLFKVYCFTDEEKGSLVKAAESDTSEFVFKADAYDNATKELLLSISKKEISRDVVEELLAIVREKKDKN